jgi:hypothetical protein
MACLKLWPFPFPSPQSIPKTRLPVKRCANGANDATEEGTTALPNGLHLSKMPKLVPNVLL